MDSVSSIQCVNCGISLRRLRRWMAEENEDLRQLLSDWACKEPEYNDAVCHGCYSLLQEAVKNDNKSRKFGHKSVCLACGSSILLARSKNLTNHLEQKLEIVQWVPPHQVKRLENSCWRCWQKASRIVKSKHVAQANSIHVKIEPLQSILGYGELDIPASPSSSEATPEEEPPPSTITMDTYRRAPDSASRCMFRNCKSTQRLRLPKVIRERLLVDYSFYTPSNARVCEEHLYNSHKDWSDLYNNSKMTDFTVAHMEDLCSILKYAKHNFFYRNNIFESLIRNDEYLCHYWFGVKYSKFSEMLKTIAPLKKELKCLVKSLGIYLMKQNTGFSYEKIELFFKVVPAVLVKKINLIHEFLENKAASVGSDEVTVPSVSS